MLLKSNKFYVGHTANMMKTMDMHFSGSGPDWTKKYEPIQCIFETEGNQRFSNKLALALIIIVGKNNIRDDSNAHIISQDKINKFYDYVYDPKAKKNYEIEEVLDLHRELVETFQL